MSGITAEEALDEELQVLREKQKSPDDCPVCWREVDEFKKHKKGHGFLFHLACFKCKLCRRRLTEATCRVENGDWVCIPGKCDDGSSFVVTTDAQQPQQGAETDAGTKAPETAAPVYEEDDSDGHLSDKAMSQLLNWCREKLAHIPEVKLTGFNTKSWSSGLAFCGLVHLFVPDLVDLNAVRACDDPSENLELAFDLAEEELDFVGSLFEDEREQWPPQDIFSYVGQFYIFEKKQLKRKEEEERAQKEAELVEKMTWGDAFGEIFDLPEFQDPKNLSMTEAQEATQAYKQGWGAVVDFLGKHHSVDEEAHRRRVEAVAKLDEKTAFKPLPETSNNGGYFSEELRRKWYEENEAATEECERQLGKLLETADAESEDNVLMLGQLQMQLELHRAYAAQLTEMAGKSKQVSGGGVSKNEELAKMARAEEEKRNERNPFGLKRKICRGCMRVIYKLEEATAKTWNGQMYHTGCFRCFDCENTLRVEHGMGEYKGKLYCSQHLSMAQKPRHQFGDPLNTYFKLEKPADPSGVMWSWEVKAAREAYSTCYNLAVADIADKVETLNEHIKMAYAEKSPAYDRRVNNCASVDRSLKFSPIPENDIRGTHFSKKMWDGWMKDVDSMIEKAIKDRSAFQEIQEKLNEESAGRTRRNQRRQRSGGFTARLAMAESLTRKERMKCLKYLEGCLEDLGRYKRQLLLLSHKVLGGEDPDELDRQAKQKELEAKRKAAELARVAPNKCKQTKCFACEKNVYQQEKLVVDDIVLHRVCFRCFKCKSTLKADKYVISVQDELFCPRHAPKEDDKAWEISRFNPRRASRLPGRIFEDGKDPLACLLDSSLPPPADPIAALEDAILHSGDALPSRAERRRKSAFDAMKPPADGDNRLTSRSRSDMGGKRNALAVPAGDPTVASGGAGPRKSSQDDTASQTSAKSDAETYAAKSFGMDRAVRSKIAAKYDQKSAERVIKWMSAVLGEELNQEFQELLKDGQVLCRLINAIEPNTIKFSKKNQGFHHRANIGHFLRVCEEWGVISSDIFQTIDLYEAQNLNNVVLTIEALVRAVHAKYPNKYPKL